MSTTHKIVIKPEGDYFAVSCSACPWVGYELRDSKDECKDDFTEHLMEVFVPVIRMNARGQSASPQSPLQASVSPEDR